MATPATGAIPPPSAASPRAAKPDRRLRLDDVLKLMVADGLIAGADADKLARSRTMRFEHPLEAIADQAMAMFVRIGGKAVASPREVAEPAIHGRDPQAMWCDRALIRGPRRPGFRLRRSRESALCGNDLRRAATLAW